MLARSHLLGDFGFCRYAWSSEESTNFLTHFRLPKTAQQLPCETEIVPLYYFTQHAEAAYSGPNVRPRHFRRLDASSQPRLTFWDLGGPDVSDARIPIRLAVVPTEDIMPDAAQRAIFQRNLERGQGQLEEKNPNLSALLDSGLFAGEYGVGLGGPLPYDDRSSWESIWELLNAFTLLPPVRHPTSKVRDPQKYRISLRMTHQRLLHQHRIQIAGREESG